MREGAVGGQAGLRGGRQGAHSPTGSLGHPQARRWRGGSREGKALGTESCSQRGCWPGWGSGQGKHRGQGQEGANTQLSLPWPLVSVRASHRLKTQKSGPGACDVVHAGGLAPHQASDRDRQLLRGEWDLQWDPTNNLYVPVIHAYFQVWGTGCVYYFFTFLGSA